MVSDWDDFPQPDALLRESWRPNSNPAPRKAVIMFFVVYQIWHLPSQLTALQEPTTDNLSTPYASSIQKALQHDQMLFGNWKETWQVSHQNPARLEICQFLPPCSTWIRPDSLSLEEKKLKAQNIFTIASSKISPQLLNFPRQLLLQWVHEDIIRGTKTHSPFQSWYWLKPNCYKSPTIALSRTKNFFHLVMLPIHNWEILYSLFPLGGTISLFCISILIPPFISYFNMLDDLKVK
jgi:hypothetical protein